MYVNIPKHKLSTWAKVMPKFIYNPDIPFFELLVPTLDTVRFGNVMELLLNVNYPVLFTGDTGRHVFIYSFLNLTYYLIKGSENLS